MHACLCSIATTGIEGLMNQGRLVYLDQVRGYAIFGMILVNILGMFDVMPWILKHHHEGFSYADHIAPLFLFIVGRLPHVL